VEKQKTKGGKMWKSGGRERPADNLERQEAMGETIKQE